MLQALIFDVDGTLADTELAHLAAFNHAFAAAGLGCRWDVPLYTRLLEVSGGRERIRAYLESRGDIARDLSCDDLEQAIARIHALKNAAYEQAVQEGQVRMRPGVLALMKAASESGLALAIATTTSPVNIASLLTHTVGADWRDRFAVIEDASTAPRKKPDPMVYRQALARLGLPASACLALEDSGNGLKAALQAGLPTIVTVNDFTAHHDFSGALRVLPSLADISLPNLLEWHAESQAAAQSRRAS